MIAESSSSSFLFEQGGALAHLPLTLRQRSFCRVPPPTKDHFEENSYSSSLSSKKQKFILYLPTVVLRKRHNPGFALACHLANHCQVPVIVLATILDDEHMTTTSSASSYPPAPISFTARRLAFTMEALQSCCFDFETAGAASIIRIHGPSARTPHHLTLAHQSLAVVTDEAFVEPFSIYLEKIVLTCKRANIPCWSVDGSTTVPPYSKLRMVGRGDGDNMQKFSGVPTKAWQWEKQTEPQRKAHVFGAVHQGHLNAPELKVKLRPNFLASSEDLDRLSPEESKLVQQMPFSVWVKSFRQGKKVHGVLTTQQLSNIQDPKAWSMEWNGTEKQSKAHDASVPPCSQTNGSNAAARKRWKHFLEHHLASYDKRRNNITMPHSVSRMSHYLNLGIISIFDVIADVWDCQKSQRAKEKFLQEVVKWREIGYCFTFANHPGSSMEVLTKAIPNWAHLYLENQQLIKGGGAYTLTQLDECNTGDATWNAMQRYLRETGELHNNARMTWGKTILHWQAKQLPAAEILRHICYLNDRYALDGLSPPSYAGILWCFGWGDKPTEAKGISTKWAHSYRSGPEGFERATESLLDRSAGENTATKRSGSNDEETYSAKKARQSSSPSILSFFAPTTSTKKA